MWSRWLAGASLAAAASAAPHASTSPADDGEAACLLRTLAASFAVCVLLCLLWRHLLAPRLAAYARAGASERIFLAASFVSLYPACTAPFLAYEAARALPLDDLALVMTAVPSRGALYAVGISCGYMLYDTLYCLYYDEMRNPLIIGHHVLSVLVWPYAVLQHRGLVLILFYVITEITNIGQHCRMIMLKLGYEKAKLYAVNGVLWVIAFFIVRILPSPYMLHKLAYASYDAFSDFDFWLCVLTTPLPFVLNAYWFCLLVNGVIKFFKKKAASKHESVAAGSEGRVGTASGEVQSLLSSSRDSPRGLCRNAS